jgi:4-hydroxyphenylpyruvate dioxygenase
MPIQSIPADKIFLVQLADAPKLGLDVLSWSRHFRCFPGQGAFPVTRFTKNLLASGYRGPISLEIFNDEFRAAPPRPTAVDAMRSLLLLEEELLVPANGEPASPVPRVFASPPPPVCHGVEFIEFAVDHDTRPRLADMFSAMGFAHVGTHRSKDVTLHRQGDVNLILNAEKDAFAHSFFLLHGPSVCALAFRVDDARGAIERALHYKAQTFRGRVGPNELVIPAIRGLDGSLIYLVDRADAAGTIYDVDFVAEPAKPDAPCGLTRIDHVSQVMPRGSLDGIMLFYKSVFGFEAEPVHELVDPYGLIQSRVLESRDRTVRLPLNATASPRTATARFLATYSGAGVHHIAIATDDIFTTMTAMRARQVPLLEIPATYYDGLSAMHDLAAERIDQLRALSILYDRTETGEFFHAYTHTFDGRFFFEIVQRQNYDGFGAVNASVRLAAQAMSERGEYSLDVLGELAL